MVKNDTKDQIPLFELPTPEKIPAPTPAQTFYEKGTVTETPASRKEPKTKMPSVNRPDRRGNIKTAPPTGSMKGRTAKAVPGPVPDGDVRLTANIREDLHLKLKIVAATRRTTIGELIEELVERHL
jgi:hypothetical protein